MKKLTKYLLALVVAISSLAVVDTISTEAAAWTLVDKKTTTGKVTYLNGVRGGNAKICLKDQFGGLRFDVYDNDGGSTYGPKVLSSVFINNNSCYTFYAAPYVDGADNDAEFIVQTTRTPIGTYTLELWD